MTKLSAASPCEILPEDHSRRVHPTKYDTLRNDWEWQMSKYLQSLASIETLTLNWGVAGNKFPLPTCHESPNANSVSQLKPPVAGLHPSRQVNVQRGLFRESGMQQIPKRAECIESAQRTETRLRKLQRIGVRLKEQSQFQITVIRCR